MLKDLPEGLEQSSGLLNSRSILLALSLPKVFLTLELKYSEWVAKK